MCVCVCVREREREREREKLSVLGDEDAWRSHRKNYSRRFIHVPTTIYSFLSVFCLEDTSIWTEGIDAKVILRKERIDHQ
jgi:hypothetical protein